MFNNQFKKNNELVFKFFDEALKNEGSKLAHAYILEGNCLYTQYYTALNIAKILNCKGDKTNACQCVNCKWINDNKHPEIITVSQVDYLYGNDKEKAKTVISIDQIRYLKNALSKTSDYKRVVIFSGAKEFNEESIDYKIEKEKQDFYQLVTPATNRDERLWGLEPLNDKIFQSSSANGILKLLEEPPENVMFFFLTNDKTDLIPTIVSRCQSIKFPYIKQDTTINEELSEFFNNINIKSYQDVIRTSEGFIEFSKSNNTSLEYLLTSYEEFLGNSIENNQNNISALAKILEKINSAKFELKSKVNVNSVLENLFASFLMEIG